MTARRPLPRHGGISVPRGYWLTAVWLTFGLTAMPVLAMAEADYGPVRARESLWQIASRVYPGQGLAREQIMLGLLQANPSAFTPACNVNGALRVGARLRLPAPEQVATLDAETARRRVEQQARDWAAHRQQRRPLECPAVVPEFAPDVARAPPAAEPVAAEVSAVKTKGLEARPAPPPDTDLDRPAIRCPAPIVCPETSCPDRCPPVPPSIPSAIPHPRPRGSRPVRARPLGCWSRSCWV